MSVVGRGLRDKREPRPEKGGPCLAQDISARIEPAVSHFRPVLSLVAQTGKNLSAMQEIGVRSQGQEDPLEKGKGNPLQYSCLENSMDRGAWWATVHGVTKSRTQLSN